PPAARGLPSGSQGVLTPPFGSRAKPRFSALPWPRMPTLARTTRSFAPSTRDPIAGAALAPLSRAAVPATTPAAVFAVRATNSLRVVASGRKAIGHLLDLRHQL